jgi:hypothetical protein
MSLKSLSFLVFVGSFCFALISNAGDAAHGKKPIFFPPKQADHTKSTRPAKVQGLEPAYMTTVNGSSASLSWKAADATQVFHIQVAKDPNFKWLITEDQNLKATSFEVTGLEAGHNYWWRVAGRAPDNQALYTKGYFVVSSFKTK